MNTWYFRLLLAVLLFAPTLSGAEPLPDALEKRFRQADRDKDGSLNREEAEKNWPWAAKNFDKLDKNGDGKVTIPELMERYRDIIRDSATSFDEADGNRDGYLDRDEIRKLAPEYRKKIKTMDRNRDGRVSRDEYERFFKDQPVEIWERRFVPPGQIRRTF